MNEFIFGFEVEVDGASERFVSEEAYKTQQKLKEEYRSRVVKHMDTIEALQKRNEELWDYIKVLEERINSQKKVINKIYGSTVSANITNSLLDWKAEMLQNENEVLKERLKDDIGIDYTDSTDYIAQLHKNVLNQRKELRNLNKALERERKRNRELEELTWKEKYDELEVKYTADYTSLNGVINELRKRLKDKNDKIEALESGIKELSDANDDLKKKIRSLEDNEMYTTCLKDRCGKAEHIIDKIKEALIDGNYIHHIDLRRNEK